MRIILSDQYKSLKPFTFDNLPDFTLLTGKNGAGKSHLLRSIEARAALCLPDSGDAFAQVKYFTQDTILANGSTFTSEGMEARRSRLEEAMSYFDYMRQRLESFAKDGEYAHIFRDNFEFIWNTGHEEVLNKINPMIGKGRPHAALVEWYGIPVGLAQYTLNRFQVGPGKVTLEMLMKEPPQVIALFDNPIASEFGRYRDIKLANELAEFRAQKGARGEYFIGQDEFHSLYGAPPWERMNAVLQQVGLNFTITVPPEHYHSIYTPALVSENGQSISFEDLSSGERVLMSLALCVFASTSIIQRGYPPQLILLDEVDAPLHPEMTQAYLTIIDELLVKEFGCKVIATTHSPSTVALFSPRPTVYVMKRTSPYLFETPVDEALNELTAGVPRLSLSFDGRRQVICENATDAAVYTQLYLQVKKKIQSERSLEFLGPNKAGNSSNTGSSVVRHLVETLHENGVASIRGLLDWDGKTTSEGPFCVMAEGSRDGIENVVLDPLLLAALIVQECPKHVPELGLPKGISTREFRELSEDQLQAVVDRVQRIILPRGLSGNKTIRKYESGIELALDEACLFDDHTWADAVVPPAGNTSLPFDGFKAFTKQSEGSPGQGLLMIAIAEKVARENPELLPSELRVAFEQLMS